MGAPAPRKVTVEMFHMTFLPEAKKIVDEAVAAFEKQNRNIEIKQTIVSWGDARTQFLTSMVGGIAPDIVELPLDWAGDLVGQGAFVPLDRYLNRATLDSFVPASLAACTYDGHVYGLPWETSPTGMYYRKDLFAAAELDPEKPPRNWDELIEYAKKLTVKKNGKQQWGLGIPAGGWAPDSFWLQFMYQSGTPLVKQEGGKWKSDFISAKAIRGMEFFADLVKKHKVTPESVTGMEWEQIKNGFVFGDFAMMVNGMFVMDAIHSTAPELKGKWATASFPAGPDGDKASVVIPNSLYITKQSKNPAEAAKFLQFFFSGQPSFASRYCIAGGIVGMQKHFADLDYAKDQLRKPFIDSLAFGKAHPMAPKYAEFREIVLNPALQDLLRGQRTAKETCEYLDSQLTRLLQQ